MNIVEDKLFELIHMNDKLIILPADRYFVVNTDFVVSYFPVFFLER